MKFEKVRIHFLSDVLVCCHSTILLPWQHDVTTSLYWVPDCRVVGRIQFLTRPTLMVLKLVRRNSCLCFDTCKCLDGVLVFLD